MALVLLPILPRLFETMEWTLETPQTKNRSRWTGRTQVVGLPGAPYWTVNATVQEIATEAQARKWRAFMASLRGSENTFLMPALHTPQGSFVEPTVTANVAGGRQVDVNDATNIAIGMHISILLTNGHYRLCVVVAKAVNRISLEPELAGTAAAAAVRLNNPVSTMRMRQGQTSWVDSGGVGFTLDADEAL